MKKKEVKVLPNFELALFGLKRVCEITTSWQKLPNNRTQEIFAAEKKLSKEEETKSRENKFKATYFQLLSDGIYFVLESGLFENEEEASKWNRERRINLIETINVLSPDGNAADINENQIKTADSFACKFIERAAEILEKEKSSGSADRRRLVEIINIHREKIKKLME